MGVTYAIPNFLGGELSQFAQGRFDRPDYRVSLNVCLNAFPVEMGPWVRRPGFRFAGAPRGGAPARVIKFDFEQSTPYAMEFTDGFLRFRNGAALVATNDPQTVSAVSTANPAVVQTLLAHGWSTGNTVIFDAPGPAPLLENRQFIATVIDTFHFSLTDALTGATIDGATLGTIKSGTPIRRVQELTTAYPNGLWSTIRSVQAETTALLLTATVAPQALTVSFLPQPGSSALFELAPADFLDGPYLDPIPDTVITPSATKGTINITLSLQVYDASQSYSEGDYVMQSTVGYISLVDNNSGNTPSTSPTFWQVVNPAVAINDGQGFIQSDIGRHVRFYNPASAPAWDGSTTYGTGDLVTNSSIGYISLQGNNINNTPSATSAFWAIYTPGWTWGKITALSTAGLISPAAGSPIGGFGNLAAAFDGTVSQKAVNSAAESFGGVGVPAQYQTLFIGKDFSADAQAVTSALVYPSSDFGYATATPWDGFNTYIAGFNISLYASQTPPANAFAGTLLAQNATLNYTSHNPITLVSKDQVTEWKYVWIVYNGYFYSPQEPSQSGPGAYICGQIQFFGTSGVVGTGASVQLFGSPLPNTASISTWQLGAYSNTTGFPTCGCYDGGRIWLGGAIPNRFDASVSNGIKDSTIDFAPTDNTGQVLADSAISYTLNSDSVNPIFWFQPDLQGIIIGTQAGEWLVQAPTNGPISAINIAAHRVTKIGCANVEPRRTEHTNVFVQRYSKKLMEYFSDVYSGKFSAPNIADKAEHITRLGIMELGYQQAATPLIWGRDTAGALFGVTYKRDTLTTAQGPTFNAWHRHALGSGRIVESLCVGPSVGGDLDALTVVTNDASTNIRHVEVLTDTMDELTPLESSWLLDDAVVPTSTSTSDAAITGAPRGGLTLNGLWHLNGKTVQVFAGGLDCGDPGEGKPISDFLVTNGSCFVPYGDGISAGPGRGQFTSDFAATPSLLIVVGFTYNSDGQMVRPIAPADTGNRNGPALGLIRRNHRYAMLLSNTLGLSVGATFTKMYPANFKQADGASSLSPLTTFSGVHQDSLQDDYGYDGMMCWRVSRPLPANVIAISGNIDTQAQ